MRRVEWINLVAFSFFIIASFFRPLTNHRRMTIATIGATGIALLTAMQFANRFLPPSVGSATRDWLPALLMPMVYWQAGRFSVKVNQSFQTLLQNFDEQLLNGWRPHQASTPTYRWISKILELAYLSCYVLVPLGLGFLYLEGLQRHAAEYWSVVLLATYPCYAFTAFVPTQPPRVLESDSAAPVTNTVRTLNLWIVRWFSIQINTFPSAHVTATVGSSLVLLYFVPSVGLVFLMISIGIALGAALGRYHYTADVLVGAALSVAVFALELWS